MQMRLNGWHMLLLGKNALMKKTSDWEWLYVFSSDRAVALCFEVSFHR